MRDESIQDFDDNLDDLEILLHRFVDDNLDSQERLQLFQALDRDPQLRAKLLEIQGIVAQAAQLPRLRSPVALKARVLRELPARQASVTARLTEFLVAPRVLRWNPGMALVVFGVIAVLAWSLYQGSPSIQGPIHETRTGVVKAQILVRLMLIQPQAKSVAVAGDFNGWMPDRTPLRMTTDGVWTVTIQVKPGRYRYMFVVDGKEWVTDPLAVEYSMDGFGDRNAVLDVDTALRM
ncbi:MAG: hypothetical protein ACE5NA_04200 [Nitrospiraceae bacterium]